MRSAARAKSAGVSLIELVIVIVAVTVGVVAIGNAYMASAGSISFNEDVQHTWQAAQACADHALGLRRASGTAGAFSNITVGMANPCPTVNAITPAFTVTDTTNAGACSALGAANTCRLVAIVATQGAYTANVNFVVVDY